MIRPQRETSDRRRLERNVKPLCYIADDQRKTLEEICENLQAIGFDIAIGTAFGRMGADLRAFKRNPRDRPDLFLVDLSWTTADKDFREFDRRELTISASGPEVGWTIVSEIILGDELLRDVPVIIYSGGYDAEPARLTSIVEKGGKVRYFPRETLGSSRRRADLRAALEELGVSLKSENGGEGGDLRPTAVAALAREIDDEVGAPKGSTQRLIGALPGRNPGASLTRSQTASSRLRHIFGVLRLLRLLYSPQTLRARVLEPNLFGDGVTLLDLIKQADWAGFELVTSEFVNLLDGV
jgi:hypothetical protein